MGQAELAWSRGKGCLPQPLRDPKSLDHRASSGHLRGRVLLKGEEFQECEVGAGNRSSESVAERGCVQEVGPTGTGMQSGELMRGLWVMESSLIPLRRVSLTDSRALELLASLYPGSPRRSCFSAQLLLGMAGTTTKTRPIWYRVFEVEMITHKSK